MTRIYGNDLLRFELRVEPVPIAGCWIWTGVLDGHDYGKMWFRGGIEKAHRIAWQLFNGRIPDGAWVLHRCDTPACVNPSHLFLGDRVANMRDMAKKGRQVFQANPWKVRRGDRAAAAKLSEGDAITILERLRRGEHGAALAREYGVSKCTISALKVGRNWPHLHREDAQRVIESAF